jgi:DNA-binding MurR/RpiR family transcriptional regulator
MTAGHGQKRQRLEDRALAALLSEATIAQAAAKANVSESTLLRWLAEPSFKARYRDARRQVVELAVTGLQQATSEAVATLSRNLICGIPASEISAAKAVLDFAVKGVELVDLAERVEALEQASELAAERESGKR